MALQIEYTKNGKPCIQYLNNKFRESNSVKNGEIIWRCLGSKCRANVKTDADKATILSVNNNHSGPHPITMRALTSHRQTSSPSPSVTPAAETDTPRVAAPSTSTPRCATPPTTPHIPATTTPFCELEEENTRLRSEVDSLKKEMNMILDHTIESDSRLLQYTDQIFTVNNSVVGSKQVSKCDVEIQCNFPPPHSSECLIKKNHDLQQTLDKCLVRIKELEMTVASYADTKAKYEILLEESRNMVDTIRCLEEDNKQLKITFDIKENNMLMKLREKERELTVSENKFKTLLSAQSTNKINNLNGQVGPNSLLSYPCTNVAKPLPVHNTYESLEHLEDERISGFTKVSRKKKNKNKNIKQKQKTSLTSHALGEEDCTRTTPLPFKKVTLLGDSHARYLASLMLNKTDSSTQISGECKPGAGLLSIAPASTTPASPGHCYVILAGTNDVAAGRPNIIFRQLENIINNCCKASRVLLVPLPPRYDLPSDSPVHHLTSIVNHYMAELCGRHEDADILDVSRIRRHHFTQHGLHLRYQGKKLLTDLIIQKLSQMTPKSTNHSKVSASTLGSSCSPSSPITLPYESYAAAVNQQPTLKSPAQQLSSAFNPLPVSTILKTPSKTLVSGGNMAVDSKCNGVNSLKNMYILPVLEKK